MGRQSLFSSVVIHQKQTCVTKILPLLSLTMAPACAKPVSLEMTPPGLSSLPLLDAPTTRVSWSVWDKRMPMSVMRLNPREVSSPRSTPLNTVSSPTGMIWRRSGITPSTMNSVLPPRSNPSSLLRLPSTPRLTVRRWLKSCSRPSTCPPCMLPSKPSFPSMPPVVPPVWSWTLVMVSPTTSPSMKVMLFPMPSSVLTWLAVSSPTSSLRSSLSVVTLSPPPLSARLSVTSRKSSAMLPLTSSKRWPPLLPPPPSRSPMSFPTVKSSPLATRGSVPPKPSSNLPSSEWNPAVSMRPPTTPSSAMLTSGRISMLTPSCPEAPPCTLVLLIVCKRKSPPLLHPPLRSRLLLPQKGNTLSGSEAPSCLPFPPSNRCGSPSKNTMSAAHPLSTGSASNSINSKYIGLCTFLFIFMLEKYIDQLNIP